MHNNIMHFKVINENNWQIKTPIREFVAIQKPFLISP